MGKPKYWETPEFLKLKIEYDKRLAASGFVDIEDQKYSEPRLKVYDAKIRTMDPIAVATKTEYYHRCYQFLCNHEWSNAIHKKIWQLHSEGIGTRAISKAIKEKKHQPDTVLRIIQYYKRIM